MTEPRPRPRSSRAPVERLRVHQAIVDHLDLRPGDVLLDLGCGRGFTLATATSRLSGVAMIGVDRDAGSLHAARLELAGRGAPGLWVQADVGAPLPLGASSVSRVVCHDVLEYLDEPVGLLAEASRVMGPGALSVWSHTDYEAIVIGGAERRLTRRVVGAYADASSLGPGRSDAQMGRKVTAAVDRSPLRRTGVDAAALIATELTGPAGLRVDDIASTVARSAEQGASDVTVGEVEDWVAQLKEADTRREFFYSQTAFVVTAVQPA